MKNRLLSGRDLFNRYRPLISLWCKAISVLPTLVRNFLWDASSNFEGRIALLFRFAALRAAGAGLGENVFIGRNVTIRNAASLVIGSNVSIHGGCYIDAIGNVTIGNNVSIAHSVSILSFDHLMDDASVPIKYNPIRPAQVVISDDVWIGCGVRVLSGVHIAERSVIGAGAVVAKPLGTGGVYVGNPVRKVRDLELNSTNNELC